ncbi:MAG: hypothetical protein AAGC95_12555 [Pseudomonadota bacterium]
MKRLYAALIVLTLSACASLNGRNNEERFSEACKTYGDVPEGETVVVMRTRSSKTDISALAAAPGGTLNDGAAVVGPVAVTSSGGIVANVRNDTTFEMRPCARSEPESSQRGE